MPMTYTCPNDCGATAGDPTSMLEHARSEHGSTLSLAALPAPSFESQYEARHGERGSRTIGCRRCASDMRKVDGVWRHTADDSLACLDPETMKPYPNSNPKENSTMTSDTMTKPRATKPSSRPQRAWFSSLSSDEKATARAHVDSITEDGSVPVSEAWARVFAAYEAAALPPAEAKPAKTNERVSRLNAAKAERRAVKEAEAAGAPRPATPTLDSMEGEQLSSRPKAAPAVKAETKRAVARAEGKALRWFVDGKPVNAPHDRLAGVSRVTARKGGERLSTDALRALLVANGIAEPDSSAWSFTLPNGVTIRTEVGA